MATTATATARRDVAFALVVLASATPLLLVRYLPFTDLPEHVAAIATMARMLPGGGGAPEYALELGKTQYLLYDLVGALLTRVANGDAILANRIVLVAIAVAWPYALRSLVRALGRDDRVAFLAPATFWSRALTIGFLPFVASVPLATFSIATLVRQLDAPTRRRGMLLGALALIVFYTHVSSFVVFGVTACALSAVRRDARRALGALLPLVPSGIAAFAWWLAGSAASRMGDNSGRLPGHRAFDAVPLWAFDVWRSHTDEICAGAWWIAFGLFAVSGLRRRLDVRESVRALTPLFCALAVYLLTPFHVGPANYLDVRLAPMLALFLILALRPADASATPTWREAAPMVLAAIASLGSSFTAAGEMLAVQREMLGDFDGLLAKMRPHTRLVTLNFEQRSQRMYFWPYVLVGSYHRLEPGSIAEYSFSQLDHWPLRYAAGVPLPPPHPGFWSYTPCMFQFRRDGSYYDYVLVQGPRSPFDDNAPGPRFREIGRSGAFLLYEKESNEDPLPDMPERGPCVPLIGPPRAPLEDRSFRSWAH